jgi:hypothetical protein
MGSTRPRGSPNPDHDPRTGRRGSSQVSDELAVDAHPLGGHVLLDAGLGQPGRYEPIQHGRRSGPVSGHTVMVQRGTDSSVWVGAAHHGERRCRSYRDARWRCRARKPPPGEIREKVWRSVIDVDLHVYYNNNSLSAAWPVTLVAIPSKGDHIEYHLPSNRPGEALWAVVGVTHFPAYKDGDAHVIVICRPLCAVEDDEGD